MSLKDSSHYGVKTESSFWRMVYTVALTKTHFWIWQYCKSNIIAKQKQSHLSVIWANSVFMVHENGTALLKFNVNNDSLIIITFKFFFTKQCRCLLLNFLKFFKEFFFKALISSHSLLDKQIISGMLNYSSLI